MCVCNSKYNHSLQTLYLIVGYIFFYINNILDPCTLYITKFTKLMEN